MAKAASISETSASDNSYAEGTGFSLADGANSQALAKGVANAETNSESVAFADSTALGVDTYAEAEAFADAKNNGTSVVETTATDGI